MTVERAAARACVRIARATPASLPPPAENPRADPECQSLPDTLRQSPLPAGGTAHESLDPSCRRKPRPRNEVAIRRRRRRGIVAPGPCEADHVRRDPDVFPVSPPCFSCRFHNRDGPRLPRGNAGTSGANASSAPGRSTPPRKPGDNPRCPAVHLPVLVVPRIMGTVQVQPLVVRARSIVDLPDGCHREYRPEL